MDGIFARLSQLEADVREQQETIVRLSSEDGAHQTAIAGLHSDVARISSENATLRTTVHDQGRVIADLSKLAAPEGFWVWESSLTGVGHVDGGGRSTGRWVWSSRYQEKYAPVPIAAASARGPSATLLSLPVELLGAIIDNLVSADQETLFFVCYRLLLLAFPHVYSHCQRFNARTAMLYIKARVKGSPRSPRISAVLDLEEVQLCGRIGRRLEPAPSELDALTYPHPVINVAHLVIHDMHIHAEQLQHWTPLLRFFNPAAFSLQTGLADPDVLLPTSTVIAPGSLAGLLSWTRLNYVDCFGPQSVPVVEQVAPGRPPRQFAFMELLRRSSAFEGQLYLTCSAVTLDDDEVWGEDVAEDDLENALLRPPKKPVPAGASICIIADCLPPSTGNYSSTSSSTSP